jgi:glycosyltransferase involved in cell wall biosynthesis
MNPIKISICIATLNRGKFIGATLKSIIAQATSEVEVVVVDGASTDDTAGVVQQCQEHFPRLRYVRQNTNMGVDRDFAEAVSLARGEYCWLFSDDDLLTPGAIQAVIDAIKEGHYGLIIANAEARNADLSKLLEPRMLPLTADRIYKSNESQRLLVDVANYLTFIGCVIIKRQLWNAREKETYFGSCFVHVGVIFQNPLPGDAVVIAKPLISIRYGNAMWVGKYFEIWMFKWPSLIWSFKDFTDSVKLQVCPKEPWRKISTLLHFRAKGVYTRKEYAEWLEPRLESPWARAVSKAIAYLPGRLINLLAFVYYSVSRPSSLRVLLIDLANSQFCFWRFRKRHSRFNERQPSAISGLRFGPTSSNE